MDNNSVIQMYGRHGIELLTLILTQTCALLLLRKSDHRLKEILFIHHKCMDVSNKRNIQI